MGIDPPIEFKINNWITVAGHRDQIIVRCTEQMVTLDDDAALTMRDALGALVELRRAKPQKADP